MIPAPLHVVTIVLDGMPFLPKQLAVFEQLAIPWVWHVSEGAAANTHCTSWCRPQERRLSHDGSSEWLNSKRDHPHIRLYRKQLWDGKVEMVNAPLSRIKTGGVLIQIDCDELWTARQLTEIHRLLSVVYVKAYFACNFYVGPNIVVTPENDPVNNVWLRAWRFTPRDTFIAHEPPILNQQATGAFLKKTDTLAMGLVFDHMSYVTEDQVKAKGEFYGYPQAVEHWKRLQKNKRFPVLLKKFLPWAKDGALVVKIP